MRNTDRYHREDKVDFNMLVVGIPNVGKSTLINKIRNQHSRRRGRVVKVGSQAGVTTAVTERILVNSNPPIYVLDTPGILEPRLKNEEAKLKLALVCKMLNSNCTFC